MTTRALLALEDGTTFDGVSFGAHGTATGEVCFNTSMFGYQEVLTDPSYHGQIVAMTAPHIGNTGVNEHDDQSARPWVAGFVVRDASPTHSSWRATGGLPKYLARAKVPAIAGVDTRRLTRHIRSAGAMTGALSTVVEDPGELVDIARSAPGLVGRDLAAEVSTDKPYARSAPSPVARIAAYDFGVKRRLIDLLVERGLDVCVVPATTPAADVLSGGFDGVFLSNGPGDPEPLGYAIDAVRALLGRIPVLGICLGHQLLALALGARTYKLPFGHRGGNHPVRRLGHDRIEITCQNHGFAVNGASVAATGAGITHVNLNDGTVEGIGVPGLCLSVQYHPESAPGPHDSRYVFEEFLKLIRTFEPSASLVAG
jgi:carbamoyl-phosphate synthase small subunit